MVGCAKFTGFSGRENDRFEQSPQFSQEAGKFRNQVSTNQFSFGKLWGATREVLFNKHPETTPADGVAIQPLNISAFEVSENQSPRFARLGHSTLLIQLGGKNWLTDPVFSKRASPVQWAGPKRFHEVPVDIEQLPDIEGVLISHNHYDHLDYGSIQILKDSVNHFIVPLGIRSQLREWGVDESKIIELDWWQTKQFGDIELVSTPAQHFSGRGLLDSDKTLWSSWVIRTKDHSLYFSGDTGYFAGFKEIGERYGPFDYAFMECGAYNRLWRDIHMMPEDTLQAFKDVQGKVLVPIHNGTFDLSNHAWFDPMERITALAQQENIQTLLPVIGETISYSQTLNRPMESWWKRNSAQ
ncbi:MBL fold metallo-hydrolase [Parendozoicomonas sp. Alg238-R29]|uniref:MBL fold metallo-hydrolase n=1 Tax=Parendozoicomonas sp. Alg238-R29 TaxID=2993446 RepID=UPI00248E2943|nr:MBL fold metallo-hydrolase [Parendozoicomonas sp. Alg238-R29]